MRILGYILGAILSLLLIVALAFGGRELGWWLKADNTRRNVEIVNHNTGTQTAWHDQAVQDIRDYNTIPVENAAARSALRNDACMLIGRLDDSYLDDTIVVFQSQEC